MTAAMIQAVAGGLAGPLFAAVATWFVVTYTQQRNPAGVTQVMLMAFMVKALFFAAYVVAMVKVVGLELVPFALSFGVCFIAFYAVQAWLFARLFSRASLEAPGGASPSVPGSASKEVAR